MLGIDINAKESAAKAAFKALVKLYHPDNGPVADTGKYNQVVEAYNFLCPKSKFEASQYKVMGQGFPTKTTRQPSSAKDYASFEKKIAKQKQQKAAAFEQKTKEYSAKLEKQEADYKRAMEAIDAIRAARAIESMIWANGLEKDQRPEDD